jgi:hypothetical protein
MIPKDLQDWLKQDCPDTDIAYKDGVKHIPIEVCERKLDHMQDRFQVVWCTENYKSSLYHFNNEIWISASLELVIKWRDYGDDSMFEKRIVGCATFRLSDMLPNHHLDATAKSLCVVNACSDLGEQFGRSFNKQQESIVGVNTSKQKPDIITKQKYKIASSKGDADTIKRLEEQFDFSELNQLQ